MGFLARVAGVVAFQRRYINNKTSFQSGRYRIPTILRLEYADTIVHPLCSIFDTKPMCNNLQSANRN